MGRAKRLRIAELERQRLERLAAGEDVPEHPAKCVLFGGDKGNCRTTCTKCWKEEPKPVDIP